MARKEIVADDVKNVMNVEIGGKFPNVYDVVIKQAVTIWNDKTETNMLHLALEVPEFNKVYDMDPICIENKKNDDYTKRNMKVITNLIYLVNPGIQPNDVFKIENIMANRFDKETGKREDKLEEQYINLIGKRCKALIKCDQIYPKKNVNGYTGKAIPTKKENEEMFNIAIQDHAVIQIPDYSKKTAPKFSVEMWFNSEGKTLEEVIKNQGPETMEKALTELDKYRYHEQKIVGPDHIEKVKKTLINALKKHKENFDEARFLNGYVANYKVPTDADNTSTATEDALSEDVPF